MNFCKIVALYQQGIQQLHKLDFLAPLALRLYLVPVFWMSSNNKWNPFDSESSLDATIEWFGNPDWGLGLPYPDIMGYLAWGTEYIGTLCLLLGLAVRLVSIPLMITMVVAAITVHWDNGWLAIAPPSEQLDAARSILQEYGNYDWLTQNGPFVILNNGIEFAATYFIMLLTLLFIGGGRYISLDYWFAQQLEVCKEA